MLIPRGKTPDLNLPLVGGGTFDLARDGGSRGTLLCFYRGRHCPVCITQLKDMGAHVAGFAERGVKLIAVSADPEDRASDMAKAVGDGAPPLAYNLPLSEARDWGLFISTGRGTTSIGIEEPELFSEPGLFMINADQTLYYQAIQTMPFTRPSFGALLGALDFAIEKNYPARGAYTGPV